MIVSSLPMLLANIRLTEHGIIVLVLLGTLFWMFTLGHLMSQRNEVFRGHNDKLIWAIILLISTLLGAVVYWVLFIGAGARRNRTEKRIVPLEEMRKQTASGKESRENVEADNDRVSK